ncbi:MAG: zinc ribbon domain-containing protein [Candidatus Hodarchaeota archaeon]
MSSNSEYAKGLIRIKGHAFAAKEVLQALEQQAMTSVRVVGNELWVGKHRVRPIAKITPEQAMRLTCYGSLAFCCDLSRNCQLRDEAIHLLGITKEEYNAIQQDCHRQFLRYAERHWPQDLLTSSASDPSQVSPFSRDYSRAESHESWREPSASLSASRSSSPTSPSSSSSTVDLGGLFGAPDEYKARSLIDPDPFTERSRKISDEVSSFSSSRWDSPDFDTDASTVAVTQGFCIYCGQDLQDGSEFCSRCGRSQR